MKNRPIIFDCDGVLVNSEVIAVGTERDFLSKHGLHYEFAEYVSRFTGLTEDDFYVALNEDFKANGKDGLPAGFRDALHGAMWERFERELAAVDGIDDFLTAHEGDRCVASWSELDNLHKKLRMVGLHHHFDPHIYSGQQVANGKPAPDLFLFAARELGHPPETCLVIEDSVNGVRAGCAAGMAVWGFTGGGHADDGLSDRLKDAGANQVLSTFQELADALL